MIQSRLRLRFFAGAGAARVVDGKAKGARVATGTSAGSPKSSPKVATAPASANGSSHQASIKSAVTPATTSSSSGTHLDPRERVSAMCAKYDLQIDVDKTVEKYKGNAEALLASLVKKYGPEPQAAAVRESSATHDGPPEETSRVNADAKAASSDATAPDALLIGTGTSEGKAEPDYNNLIEFPPTEDEWANWAAHGWSWSTEKQEWIQSDETAKAAQAALATAAGEQQAEQQWNQQAEGEEGGAWQGEWGQKQNSTNAEQWQQYQEWQDLRGQALEPYSNQDHVRNPKGMQRVNDMRREGRGGTRGAGGRGDRGGRGGRGGDRGGRGRGFSDRGGRGGDRARGRGGGRGSGSGRGFDSRGGRGGYDRNAGGGGYQQRQHSDRPSSDRGNFQQRNFQHQSAGSHQQTQQETSSVSGSGGTSAADRYNQKVARQLLEMQQAEGGASAVAVSTTASEASTPQAAATGSSATPTQPQFQQRADYQQQHHHHTSPQHHGTSTSHGQRDYSHQRSDRGGGYQGRDSGGGRGFGDRRSPSPQRGGRGFVSARGRGGDRGRGRGGFGDRGRGRGRGRGFGDRDQQYQRSSSPAAPQPEQQPTANLYLIGLPLDSTEASVKHLLWQGKAPTEVKVLPVKMRESGPSYAAAIVRFGSVNDAAAVKAQTFLDTHSPTKIRYHVPKEGAASSNQQAEQQQQPQGQYELTTSSHHNSGVHNQDGNLAPLQNTPTQTQVRSSHQDQRAGSVQQQQQQQQQLQDPVATPPHEQAGPNVGSYDPIKQGQGNIYDYASRGATRYSPSSVETTTAADPSARAASGGSVPIDAINEEEEVVEEEVSFWGDDAYVRDSSRYKTPAQVHQDKPHSTLSGTIPVMSSTLHHLTSLVCWNLKSLNLRSAVDCVFSLSLLSLLPRGSNAMIAQKFVDDLKNVDYTSPDTTIKVNKGGLASIGEDPGVTSPLARGPSLLHCRKIFQLYLREGVDCRELMDVTSTAMASRVNSFTKKLRQYTKHFRVAENQQKQYLQQHRGDATYYNQQPAGPSAWLGRIEPGEANSIRMSIVDCAKVVDIFNRLNYAHEMLVKELLYLLTEFEVSQAIIEEADHENKTQGLTTPAGNTSLADGVQAYTQRLALGIQLAAANTPPPAATPDAKKKGDGDDVIRLKKKPVVENHQAAVPNRTPPSPSNTSVARSNFVPKKSTPPAPSPAEKQRDVANQWTAAALGLIRSLDMASAKKHVIKGHSTDGDGGLSWSSVVTTLKVGQALVSSNQSETSGNTTVYRSLLTKVARQIKETPGHDLWIELSEGQLAALLGHSFDDGHSGPAKVSFVQRGRVVEERPSAVSALLGQSRADLRVAILNLVQRGSPENQPQGVNPPVVGWDCLVALCTAMNTPRPSSATSMTGSVDLGNTLSALVETACESHQVDPNLNILDCDTFSSLLAQLTEFPLESSLSGAPQQKSSDKAAASAQRQPAGGPEGGDQGSHLGRGPGQTFGFMNRVAKAEVMKHLIDLWEFKAFSPSSGHRSSTVAQGSLLLLAAGSEAQCNDRVALEKLHSVVEGSVLQSLEGGSYAEWLTVDVVTQGARGMNKYLEAVCDEADMRRVCSGVSGLEHHEEQAGQGCDSVSAAMAWAIHGAGMNLLAQQSGTAVQGVQLALLESRLVCVTREGSGNVNASGLTPSLPSGVVNKIENSTAAPLGWSGQKLVDYAFFSDVLEICWRKSDNFRSSVGENAATVFLNTGGPMRTDILCRGLLYVTHLGLLSGGSSLNQVQAVRNQISEWAQMHAFSLPLTPLDGVRLLSAVVDLAPEFKLLPNGHHNSSNDDGSPLEHLKKEMSVILEMLRVGNSNTSTQAGSATLSDADGADLLRVVGSKL